MISRRSFLIGNGAFLTLSFVASDRWFAASASAWMRSKASFIGWVAGPT